MKKVNYLKGLTLAVIALVSAFATSCSEENLSIVSNFELPDASASISISVVDLEKGELIGGVETKDATSAIGSTIEVACPSIDGYTTAKSVIVAIPAISKGQTVNVPVTFYVVNVNSAYAEIVENMVKESVSATNEETIGTMEDPDYFFNETAYDAEKTATFVVKSGMKFISVVSRAIENSVEGILSEKMKFTTYTGKYSFIVAAWEYATVTVSQELNTVTYTTKYNGETVKFEASEAGPATCTIKYAVIPEYAHNHTHNSHGHGHGAGNAGGGIIEAQ